MGYGIDLRNAACRHINAADTLFKCYREDIAGYLYGLAAEMAIKKMASLVPNLRQDLFFYAHFPELRTELRRHLRDHAVGRRAARLKNLLQDDSFMNEWHVQMRYAHAKDVRQKRVSDWQKQAHSAVEIMSAEF